MPPRGIVMSPVTKKGFGKSKARDEIVPEGEMSSRVEPAKGTAFECLVMLALKTVVPAVILFFLYSTSAILLHPFANLPFHDDWTYAWSVEHLLKTGELQVLDWSVHYPFVQILWGTVFCLPFGFSFSALRISTVMLASLGALALYGTLREFGRTRSESLLGSLVLIANPVFFVLTFSFMTDVPFVGLSNIAFLFIVRGLCRRNSCELWVGCAFGAGAFFIRQIAIAIPGSLLLYVLFARSYRSWRYVLPPIIVSLFICLTPFLIGQTFGLTTQYAGRAWVVDHWLHHYDQAMPGVLRILMHMGLALIPIGMAILNSSYRKRLFWATIGVLSLLTVCSILLPAEIPRPLEGMWQLRTLGRERHLLQGVRAPDFLPDWLNYPLFVLSLFSSAGIMVKIIDALSLGIEKPLGLLAWYAFIHFVLMLALWLFEEWGSDRYSLVLLSPLIVLLAGSELRSKLVLAGIAVLYAVSMLVTWNETQTSRATAKAIVWLRENSIPFASIDAGYVFNGWNLYAHPENLPPGAVPERDVPLVTSKENKPYVIAASPIAGYRVLREYIWSIPFSSLHYNVYVLEQLPDLAVE
jgi:Dolichyl-phosphate-mannose-protein mannosyltransferase